MGRQKLPSKQELLDRIERLEKEVMVLRERKDSMAEHIVWMVEASETMIGACKVLMKGVDFEDSE